jgi:hypothetical protein
MLLVHAPILDRLGDVPCLDVRRLRKIGDGARHFENAVVGARRQPHARDGLSEQLGSGFVGRAQGIDFLNFEFGVGLVLALQLPRVGRLGARLDLR